MSDIFISYSSPDRERAGWLAALLVERGWSVFWDRTIPPGKSWDEVIGSELHSARAVIVLWSEAAIASKWVKEEAHEAKARQVLLPAFLEEVKPPFGFGLIHAASLLGWSGDASHGGLSNLMGALESMLGETSGGQPARPAVTSAVAAASDSSAQGSRAKRRFTGARILGALVAVLLVTGAGLYLWLQRPVDAPGTTAEPARVTVTEPEMIALPGGAFRMGGDADEGGSGDERPTRTVTLTAPPMIGKYEVTFDEYEAFAASTGRALPDDKGWKRGRRPVINVSRADAQDYAAWLSEQTGKRYRLPSEAEWEYAARARTETRYWWGDETRRGESTMANCKGCGSHPSEGLTAPVGSFEANAFGLHDMHGNVWEWVQDCWHDSYQGAPLDGSAWLGAGSGHCGKQIVRGGSWNHEPKQMRSAYRGVFDAGHASETIGFRLVREE